MVGALEYGRYLLDERIAMGGMAEIFRARTRTEGFEKVVCIKRVLPFFLENEDFVAMFRDEAQVAAKLQHGNVVQVFDFGEVDGTLYLAMEFVDGADLRGLMDIAKKRGQPFGVGQALHIGAEICRGLQHAHTLSDNGRHLGLVHRDVSPHNVLLSKTGDVKITDFGIAKAAERVTHTSTGVVKGKLSYMAPEQAEGALIDHRVDQFAAGIVIWEMLTGQRLFHGANEAAILRKVLICDVPKPEDINPRVPAEASAALMPALSMNPDDRYSDMRAFERALTRAAFALSDDADFTNVRLLVETLLAPAANEPEARRTALIASDPAIAAPSAGAKIGDASAVFTSSDKVLKTPRRTADGIDPHAQTVFTDDGETASAEPALDPTPDDTAPTRTVVPEALLASSVTAPQTDDVHASPARASPGAPVISFPHKEAGDALVSTERVPRAAGEPALGLKPRGRAPAYAALGIGALALLAAAAFGTYSLTRRGARVVAQDAPAVAASNEQSGDSASARHLESPTAQDAPLDEGANEPPDDMPTAAVKSADAKAPAKPIPNDASASEGAGKPKSVAAEREKPRSRAKRSSRTKKRTPRADKATGTGKVAVQIRGSWAYVSVGKKRLGEAPGVFSLPAGKHRLTLENPELKKKTQRSVTVKPGETTMLRLKF